MMKTRTVPEKAMATHSSTLAWEIQWTEEPGRLNCQKRHLIVLELHYKARF